MKKGRLLEVQHGVQTPVKRNITLVNGTTIHTNGKIDYLRNMGKTN